MRPRAHRSYRHSGWSNEGPRRWWRSFCCCSQSRLGIDRLATPLGIDETLAFRAFDKTIIFGHWLLKTHKLALASGAFLLKKTSTLSQQTIFKKAKIFFQKTFSKREALRYFQHGALLLSSHALQLSFTCKHMVAKFNLCYTFIRFPYINLLCFKNVFPLH